MYFWSVFPLFLCFVLWFWLEFVGFCVLCFVLLLFETVSYSIVQAGLKLTMTPPPYHSIPRAEIIGLCLYPWAYMQGGFELRKAHKYASHQIPPVRDCMQIARLIPLSASVSLSTQRGQSHFSQFVQKYRFGYSF